MTSRPQSQTRQSFAGSPVGFKSTLCFSPRFVDGYRGPAQCQGHRPGLDRASKFSLRRAGREQVAPLHRCRLSQAHSSDECWELQVVLRVLGDDGVVSEIRFRLASLREATPES